MGWPAALQEPVEEPVDAMPEVEGGAALEPEALSTGAAAGPAAEDEEAGAAVEGEGEAATKGAAAATEGDATTVGAVPDTEGAAAGAAAPEAPELPALEASTSVPEEALDELPVPPHLGPVGGVKTSALSALAISTEAPGSGNLTSAPAAVVQSVAGMFAMNISGNEAVARSESSGIAYS